LGIINIQFASKTPLISTILLLRPCPFVPKYQHFIVLKVSSLAPTSPRRPLFVNLWVV